MTMKNSYLKQIAAGVMIALTLCMSAMAASITYSPSGAATNTVFSGTANTNRAGAISQIVIANASPTATVVVRLIDAPATTLTYTNAGGAWTNHVRSIISFTNVYTDILGNSVTNIYQTVTNTVSAALAATNSYRTIGTWTVSSNSTVTIPYSTPNVFGLGILATNNGAASITISYLQF